MSRCLLDGWKLDPAAKMLVAVVVLIACAVPVYSMDVEDAAELAFAAMFTFYRLIDNIPLTPHPAAWYLGTTLVSLAFLVAPALYGFKISRAGRPLFRDEVLEAPGAALIRPGTLRTNPVFPAVRDLFQTGP